MLIRRQAATLHGSLVDGDRDSAHVSPLLVNDTKKNPRNIKSSSNGNVGGF